MTREEVLGLSFTADQRARVEATYLMFDKLATKNPQRAAKTINELVLAQTQEEVIAYANTLVDNYNKRQAAKAKAKAKKAKGETIEVKTAKEKIDALLANAASAGITDEEILEILETNLKEKINAKVNATIADYKAKLAEAKAMLLD